jgi:tetratricopeptide (TPR) repeat protein
MAAVMLPATVRAEVCKEWAKIVSLQGDVKVRVKGGITWEAASTGDIYCPGDAIRVGARSRAALELSYETIIRLDQNTTVTLLASEPEKRSLIDLLTGAVHFISRVPRTLKVITPYVNAAVEGTEFLVRVERGQAVLTVFEGVVLADNPAGRLTLTSGQSAVVQEGLAPALRVLVRPRDAVQWALYYPPIIDLRPGDYETTIETGWQERVRASIDHYWGGDFIQAFSDIADVSDEIPDPRFFNYRAALLLWVGRADEAVKDIQQSLRLAPDNSTAMALQAIIALVQNDKERARSLAQKAVLSNPDSATARVALSYARQANFDVKGALAALQAAVQLDPQNALAWARLSELQLSLGSLDDALNAAKRAVELNPRLARTQSVLGFAYLSQVKTASAKEAFQEAIALDPPDPLARMGLGLAMIREGNLKEGRREMEIATSLDPNHSLIRSYMGKAYYEEKRNTLAMSQYDIARELDPQDPTPFFYDAIGKQSVNRPVEALHDMEQAIGKNDNRAVYRSKLLLDDDLAARSAGLARIYSDLGFEQLALVEGWKSVNTDPGSYSAHRFLADNYSALPRHEIARVSELLQSQLLQPINITPVQPQLAERSLFIFNGAGPGDLSFHEFNPIFNRDRLALQISGVGGGDDTLGDEVVVSGIEGKFSFSAGQFHYETDGFRENNDQEQDIYNLFAQIQLSHKTSLLAEYRNTSREEGDLTLNFDLLDFDPTLRQDTDEDSIRLGARHALAPHSEIIATVIYHDREEHARAEPFPSFLVDIGLEDKGYLAEVEHFFRSQRFSITSGAGHYSSDEKFSQAFLPLPPDVEKSDVRVTNAYFYSEINYPEALTLTIGAMGQHFGPRRFVFSPNLSSPAQPLNRHRSPDSINSSTTVRAMMCGATVWQSIRKYPGRSMAGWNIHNGIWMWHSRLPRSTQFWRSGRNDSGGLTFTGCPAMGSPSV